MISFKNIFKFSRTEVDYAFAHIVKKSYINGIRILTTALPEQQAPHGKLLIITSRKVGKAHIRNKLRRQIKHSFYKHRIQHAHHNWIFILSPKSAQLSYQHINSIVSSLQKDNSVEPS